MNHAYYTANDTRSNEDNFPQWTNVLFSVVLPAILVVGVTGNLLTLIIMCRKSQRFSSTAVYLKAKRYCSRKKSVISVSVFLLLVVAINLRLFWTRSLDSQQKCINDPQWQYFE